MASVGTGCGGFQGYFSIIIIPSQGYCPSKKKNKEEKAEHSTPTI